MLGLGLGLINTLIFALQADTVDYGEWKRRSRRGRQLLGPLLHAQGGPGIGGAAAAFTIGLGGYVSGAADPERRRGDLDQDRRGDRSGRHHRRRGGVMLTYPLTEKSVPHGRRRARRNAARRAAVPHPLPT